MLFKEKKGILKHCLVDVLLNPLYLSNWTDMQLDKYSKAVGIAIDTSNNHKSYYLKHIKVLESKLSNKLWVLQRPT